MLSIVISYCRGMVMSECLSLTVDDYTDFINFGERKLMELTVLVFGLSVLR